MVNQVNFNILLEFKYWNKIFKIILYLKYVIFKFK